MSNFVFDLWSLLQHCCIFFFLIVCFNCFRAVFVSIAEVDNEAWVKRQREKQRFKSACDTLCIWQSNFKLNIVTI